MGLVGGTVTASARALGHSLSFGVTLAMLMGMIAFVAFGSTKRGGGTYLHQYGPLYLTLLSFPLIMADPLRHVLQDVNAWPAPGSSQYRSDCAHEDFTCLTTVGWLFTVVMTYSGFICLIVGSFWSANIIDRLKDIRAKWRELRGKSGSVNNSSFEPLRQPLQHNDFVQGEDSNFA